MGLMTDARRTSWLCVLIGTVSLTIGAQLVHLASRLHLQQAELIVSADSAVRRLQMELDYRCKTAHDAQWDQLERIEAKMRWYIMRRSGIQELIEMEEEN